jgi:hypothetical protein
MADSENNLATLAKRRQALMDQIAKADTSTPMVPNPEYKKNYYDPNSYLSAIPADPKLAQPLPTGRGITPSIVSDVNATRMANVGAFMNDAPGYFKENTQLQNNEQSLLDKGKSLLGKIADFHDDSDLELFGVNLSGVESTFDGFMSHFIGAYDLLNVGMGALVSAAPGGVRTLEFSELSGGKGVGQVFGGEMEHGDAPSVGQIAIASVAIEAKRIREGGARLSDVLLLNPATAPFILAAMKADTSPLQKDGFDIMNKEQREAGFGSGFEQWFSGITDAGLMFADPLIGAGFGAKIAKAGLLGARTGLSSSLRTGTGLRTAVGELDVLHNKSGIGTYDAMDAVAAKAGQPTALAAGATPEGALDNAVQFARIDSAVPRPKNNPLAMFLYDIGEFMPDGTKKMSISDIANRLEIKNTTQTMTIASMLHRSQSYGESAALIEYMTGVKGSGKRLEAMAPSLKDEAHRLTREDLYWKAAVSEPQKLTEIDGALSAQIDNIQEILNKHNEYLKKSILNPDGTVKAGMEAEHTNLMSTIYSKEKTMAQAVELREAFVSGKHIDALDPTSAGFDSVKADAIIADMKARNPMLEKAIADSLNRSELFAEALRSTVSNELRGSAYPLITNTNVFARQVANSRTRRARAASQFAQEKTAIFPRNGQGWIADSTFPGTTRWQRNARVWRWAGHERPVGLIGLHGTATVGAHRELLAGMDLGMYREAKPISREINVRDEAGNLTYDKVTNAPIMETVLIGGQQKRQELIGRYAAAVSDPKADNFMVLQEIEMEIARDFARLYNLSAKGIEDVMKLGNRDRVANLDMVRKGTFVDPVDATVHHIPLGPEQLANSTYMQNFQAMEKILKETALDNNAMNNMRKTLETPADYGKNAYKLFNDVWRPATLMRISYTTRNNLDGLVRSMAYNGSLAPLLWPIKATAYGVRNKVVARVVTRNVASTGKLVENSAYMALLSDYNIASDRLAMLRSAQPEKIVLPPETITKKSGKQVTLKAKSVDGMRIVVRDPATNKLTREVVTVAEWQARHDAQAATAQTIRDSMEANVAAYDKAVSGTRFGKWREENLKMLDERIKEHEAFLDAVNEPLQAGGATEIAQRTLDDMNKLVEANAIDMLRLNDLKFLPTVGAAMYREGAGRAKRIGSGTSMHPDGNYYNDAFAGPFEQLNRRMLSSDSTYKMVMTLRGDVWNSIYRRTIVSENVPVPFNKGKNEDQWAVALAAVLERATANPLVQEMVKVGWNEEKGLAWLIANPRGQDFYDQIRKMFGMPGATLVPKKGKKAKKTKINPYGTEETMVSGERVVFIDPEEARTFIRETTQAYRAQLQNPRFEDIFTARAKSKMDKGKFGSKAIDGQAIKDVLRQMSDEEKDGLGFVQGNEIIDAGTESARNAFTRFTSTMFKYLGTIPEDAISRGPFYAQRFKETRNDLISQYWEEAGVVVPKRRVFGASGRSQGGTLEHPQFKIPASRISEIEVQAHRKALALTREYMYTIERQTNLGKYGEWFFPFISAQQNTLTVAGKLLSRNPWLAPTIADIWRMPNRLGWEDEEGNLQLPMPASWLIDALKDNPNIPIIGGVLDSNDMITIPKNGLNVWAPDSGFGILPRPAAWAQVAASQLMKMGLFPVETPEIVKKLMPTKIDPNDPEANPDANADDFYKTFKDYIFGEDSGASAELGSWDKLLPAWVQKGFNSTRELSNQYGYKYVIQWHTQMSRWMMNDRPEMPTPEEINKRVTNAFWFDLFGNQGIPTPLTPYPIFTRPVINSPVEYAQDILQMYRQVDPVNAEENMARQMGEWMLNLANTKITKNIGGGNAVPETITDTRTFDSLIRKISTSVPENNLDVIGMIINNRGSSVDYEKSAYSLQMAQTIPGSNNQFREVQSGQQSTFERQKVAGWTKYRMAMDQYDARLVTMGLSSYEVNAASELKAAKSQFIAGMLVDPEFAGWAVDYRDTGGAKTNASIRAMELAVNDETFVKEMSKEDKTNSVLNIMREYTNNRRILVGLLKNSGHNIDHENNAMLKLAWGNMRQGWKNASVRWSEIASMYLASDENPELPGSVVPELMQSPVASMSGVS